MSNHYLSECRWVSNKESKFTPVKKGKLSYNGPPSLNPSMLRPGQRFSIEVSSFCDLDKPLIHVSSGGTITLSPGIKVIIE